jgi:hypothetical protein
MCMIDGLLEKAGTYLTLQPLVQYASGNESKIFLTTVLFTGSNGTQTEYKMSIAFDKGSDSFSFWVEDAQGTLADEIRPTALSGRGNAGL